MDKDRKKSNIPKDAEDVGVYNKNKERVDTIKAWRTEDGRLCIGTKCFSIEETRDHDAKININEDACGKEVAEAYGELFKKTIGSSGDTVWKSPSKKEKEKEE